LPLYTSSPEQRLSEIGVRAERRQKLNTNPVAVVFNPQNRIPTNLFRLFQQFFDMLSTCLQQIFAFFNISLVFFVFASKIRRLLITSETPKQTESKGNFE
jgi:hypothetical protein